MSENREIHKTFDLALRIGEVLLSSGAGTADVTATISSVAYALGVRTVDVDVTFTTLSLTHQPSVDEPAVIAMRQVKYRDIDYEDLTDVDIIVSDLLRGDIDREQARSRLARIVSSGHKLPRWAVTLGWGAMGSGVALVIGGNWIVVLIAFAAAAAIDRLRRVMARRRFPVFYQQVAGGLLATSFAIVTAATGIPASPSLVVTASIVMLLAGIGFMGAVQDALTGFYVTSAGRMVEAVLATAGIIAGVSGGLSLASALRVDLGQVEPGETGLLLLPVMVIGAALSAAAFAFASYAPLRSLPAIALIAAIGMSVSHLVESQDLGHAWGAATAAIAIGAVSYTLAGRVRVPPLVVVVSAIVPLLPGIVIYRGLGLIAAGESDGILVMANAGAITVALASGVILGEYLAQPLKREARRLENRLSGPRLVGPLRARAVRRERV